MACEGKEVPVGAINPTWRAGTLPPARPQPPTAHCSRASASLWGPQTSGVPLPPCPPAQAGGGGKGGWPGRAHQTPAPQHSGRGGCREGPEASAATPPHACSSHPLPSCVLRNADSSCQGGPATRPGVLDHQRPPNTPHRHGTERQAQGCLVTCSGSHRSAFHAHSPQPFSLTATRDTGSCFKSRRRPHPDTPGPLPHARRPPHTPDTAEAREKGPA